MRRPRSPAAALLGMLAMLATVGCDTTTPLERLQSEFEQYPE